MHAHERLKMLAVGVVRMEALASSASSSLERAALQGMAEGLRLAMVPDVAEREPVGDNEQWVYDEIRRIVEEVRPTVTRKD